MGGRARNHNKVYGDVVNRETDYLAATTGFAPDRLRPIVSRTARVVATENAARVVFAPNLRIALNHLPADKAVPLFERSNAENLAWNELLFRRLKTTGAAHTKSDLAAFLSRLSLKRKQPAATAPWPHNPQLGTWASYYGRFVYRGHACSPTFGSLHLPTELRKQASSAEEALSKAIWPITDRLHRAVSDGTGGDAVLADCLNLIARSLSPDDVGLLLAVDRLSTGYNVFTGLTNNRSGLRVAGGLTDILEIIGHCAEEVSVGAFDQTAAALGDLIDRRFRGLPLLRVSSFFQAIGCGRGCEANCACGTFASLCGEYRAHWATYRDRLETCFAATTSQYMAVLETAPAMPPAPANPAPLDPFLHSERP